MSEKRDLWRHNSTGVLHEVLQADALNWRSRKAFVVFRSCEHPTSEVFVCRMDAFIESFTYHLSYEVPPGPPKAEQGYASFPRNWTYSLYSLSGKTDEVPS